VPALLAKTPSTAHLACFKSTPKAQILKTTGVIAEGAIADEDFLGT